MSNPHPNTSGLKPFNKMDPKEALRIQRLGGLSRAQRNGQIISSNDKLECAYRRVQKNYFSEYDPEMNVYEQLCRIFFDDTMPLSERLRAMKYIQSIRNQNNKRIDEQNALLYKTATPEYQLSDSYAYGFREGREDVQYMDEDMNADKDTMKKNLDEEILWICYI
ncbi:MAG: hypothetical protein MJ158_01645 [Alphaproteobacteria bacterium]|nr:hypothetical protein [Alphaproteobacteria bacterium]